MVKKNCCVFISGRGTNFINLISYSRIYNFPINISLLVSDRKDAEGVLYAKKFKIPVKYFNKKDSLNEIKILNVIKQNKIEIICLAGFMRILSEKFLNEFKKTVINIHPSLLPKYKGLNTYKKVLNNKNEVKTGCTVHFVNKHLDSGKIILKKFFFLSKKENVQLLKKKTQFLEHRAYPQAIYMILK